MLAKSVAYTHYCGSGHGYAETRRQLFASFTLISGFYRVSVYQYGEFISVKGFAMHIYMSSKHNHQNVRHTLHVGNHSRNRPKEGYIPRPCVLEHFPDNILIKTMHKTVERTSLAGTSGM